MIATRPHSIIARMTTRSQGDRGGILPGLAADLDWSTGKGTDNTPVVLAALAAGVRVINLPDGDLLFRAEIVTSIRIVFRGRSNGATRIRYTGSGIFFTSRLIPGSDDMLLPCVVEGFTLFGTAAAIGAISMSEIYWCEVRCIIIGFWTGFGLRLNNRTLWTEGLRAAVQVRDTWVHYDFVVDDPTIHGTLSFAETAFENCASIVTRPGQTVFRVSKFAFVYAFKFGVKLNFEIQGAKPDDPECCLFRVEDGGAVLDGVWQIIAEQTGTIPFIQFDLGYWSYVAGTGTVLLRWPPPLMQDIKGAKHPYNRCKPGAILAMGPNCEMIPSTGGNSRIGAGHPIAKKMFAGENGEVVVAYLTAGVYKIVVRYVVGDVPVQSLVLSVSTNPIAGAPANASDVTIISNPAPVGVPAFDPDPKNGPGLAFSPLGSAYLIVTLTGAVPGGVLSVVLTIESGSENPFGDFGPAAPVVLFPDMGDIERGPVVTRAAALTP